MATQKSGASRETRPGSTVCSPRMRARAGDALLQSVIGGVVLIVVLAAALFIFNNIMSKKKEQRFYRDTMAGYNSTANPAERVRQLNMYLERYPRGENAPKIAALVEKAEALRGLDLMLDAAVVFHNGKTAPLSGRVQLLKSGQSYADLVAMLEKNAKIRKLKQQADSDENARLELFDAIGEYLQKMKVLVAGEGRFEKGKLRFSHLEPGEYLLYGVDNSGANIIGLFGALDVREGGDGDLSLESYSAYARDAERRAQRWQTQAEGSPGT